jgi:hypothetical protein
MGKATRESIIVNPSVIHDHQEETIEAKTRWFRSLTLAERMEMLCAFTELLLSANPQIVEQENAEPVEGRVRVLRAPYGVPRATFDLEDVRLLELKV